MDIHITLLQSQLLVSLILEAIRTYLIIMGLLLSLILLEVAEEANFQVLELCESNQEKEFFQEKVLSIKIVFINRKVKTLYLISFMVVLEVQVEYLVWEHSVV